MFVITLFICGRRWSVGSELRLMISAISSVLNYSYSRVRLGNIICNSLPVPGRSVHDSYRLLKSDVSDLKVQIWQVTVNKTKHSILLTTPAKMREIKNERRKITVFILSKLYVRICEWGFRGHLSVLRRTGGWKMSWNVCYTEGIEQSSATYGTRAKRGTRNDFKRHAKLI